MSLVAQMMVCQIQTIADEQTIVVQYTTVVTHVRHGCTKEHRHMGPGMCCHWLDLH